MAGLETGVVCHGVGVEETSHGDRSTGSRSRRGSSGKSRHRRGGGSGSAGGGHFPCPRGCWRPPDEGRAGPLIAVLALWIRQGGVVRRSTAWLLRSSTSQGLLPQRGEGFRLSCDVVVVMRVIGRGFFFGWEGWVLLGHCGACRAELRGEAKHGS